MGGWLADSLAIMTDAAHLLSDLLGFVISISAILVAQKKSNDNYTYGYARFEVIGAMGSIVI